MLRGAMIEYGTDFLGPIPNVVIFQINPDKMSRTIEIPPRPEGAGATETGQSGEPPTEKISLSAEFDAAYLLDRNQALARGFGIGPQLAALEKMAQPSGELLGLLGAAIDAVGDALGLGGGGDPPTQPIPRVAMPRILFIWGLTRVLPVQIDSMSINETEYDALLNPIKATVSLGLTVTPPGENVTDPIGQGAFQYSTMAKEAQAILNLANTAEQVIDLVPL
ncbi:MAG: hypothetical protein MI920_14835 [Kiloniellales bacterium]|nr:hypothetical protein [Kiloniellales bacterium]